MAMNVCGLLKLIFSGIQALVVLAGYIETKIKNKRRPISKG